MDNLFSLTDAFNNGLLTGPEYRTGLLLQITKMDDMNELAHALTIYPHFRKKQERART